MSHDLHHAPFPHLLAPLSVAGLTLRNRVVMGAIHTGLEERRDGGRALAAFYAERAAAGVGLIITGGVAPNWRGRLTAHSSQLSWRCQLARHRRVTAAVHRAGGKIALQLLHAGRYAMHPLAQAPSGLKAPISPFTPWTMSETQIRACISDFAHSAYLAQRAGYDGVELMGSEGYLIHQFLAARTNTRRDYWGGSAAVRLRFAIELVKAVRARVGRDFLLIFRLSLLDLVERGARFNETLLQAKALQAAGVNIISSGIGWHEARIPTIAHCVPHGAFAWASAKLKAHLAIPVIAANRINTPALAESILAEQRADLVALARPLLADPYWVAKAASGKAGEINPCIGCNQAC
ncbi:MAG: 2,4-dienoyl-CoA reductase FMN-binding domain-containing protein, partial [Shewanella sp.]